MSSKPQVSLPNCETWPYRTLSPGQNHIMAHLFEWPWEDIANERLHLGGTSTRESPVKKKIEIWSLSMAMAHPWLCPEGKGTTRIQHHRSPSCNGNIPDLKLIKAADGPFPERFETRDVLEQSQMFCPLWGPQFVEVSWCTHSTLSSRNPEV